jgi:hypothetical protein
MFERGDDRSVESLPAPSIPGTYQQQFPLIQDFTTPHLSYNLLTATLTSELALLVREDGGNVQC